MCGGLYLEILVMAETSLESRPSVASFAKLDDGEAKQKVGPSFSEIMEEKISSM